MAVNIKYRSADGFTNIVGPTDDLGALVASQSAIVLGTPRKIFVENIDTRAIGATPFTGIVLRRQAVGANDGIGFIRTALDASGTISKPWGLDLTAGLPNGAPTAVEIIGPYGVWAAAQEYGVVGTALDAQGETIASVEKVFEVVDLTNSWEYTLEDTPGATSYRFYRSAVPGTYGASTLVYAGPYPTFIDDGTAPTAGTPPIANTTGGAGPTYGTPPADGAFGTVDLAMFSAPAGMAVGQQYIFWYRTRLTPGASSVGNKRQGNLIPVEI